MWEIIAEQYNEDCDWTIEYNPNTGQYRISRFVDNHWKEEIIFEEVGYKYQ